MVLYFICHQIQISLFFLCKLERVSEISSFLDFHLFVTPCAFASIDRFFTGIVFLLLEANPLIGCKYLAKMAAHSPNRSHSSARSVFCFDFVTYCFYHSSLEYKCFFLRLYRPLPKHLHVPTKSGRYHSIQTSFTFSQLTSLLCDWSTFVLLENHSYVKFICKE